MANRKIVSIHSFRGGTGKSNTTANLASQVALAGKRVGIVDTDIQSPGIHVLFGLDETTAIRYCAAARQILQTPAEEHDPPG